MKHALILVLGALSSSALAESTDPLAAKLQALEQGKVAPVAKKAPAPTPMPTATAKETAQASMTAAQPQVATPSQADPRCEVKKPVAHVKKKRKPVARRKPMMPEKERLQASLTPILFEPVTVTLPEPEFDLPAHGELLQKRLAKESIEEEPGSLLGDLPGAKMEVSSDRLSFTQERNFGGRQMQGLEFPPTPTPQPRTERGK